MKEGRDLSRLRVNATSSILDPFTLAGIAGTALIIVAYFANQQGWLKADDWKYPLANLIGAVLILVSLLWGRIKHIYEDQEVRA